MLSQYFGVDWAAMCFTFVAIYLLGNQSRAGFAIMMGGNACWVVVGVLTESLAMMLANVVFFFHERTGLGQMVRTKCVMRLAMPPPVDPSP